MSSALLNFLANKMHNSFAYLDEFLSETSLFFSEKTQNVISAGKETGTRAIVSIPRNFSLWKIHFRKILLFRSFFLLDNSLRKFRTDVVGCNILRDIRMEVTIENCQWTFADFVRCRNVNSIPLKSL